MHGPIGPVSPICQKLSFLPRPMMRSSPKPVTFFQIARASSSAAMPGELRVAAVDGHDQARRVDRVDLRQQLPRPRDRVRLEVVAEREVAEHLEERVVARRLADLVEVVVLAAGADALLRRRRALVRARCSVPVNTSLNWFMPALVNSSVGSFCGTSELEATTWWPCFLKNSRNVRRTSAAFIATQVYHASVLEQPRFGEGLRAELAHAFVRDPQPLHRPERPIGQADK